MDDLVRNYTELAFHEDLAALIFKAFHLFNLYNYLDYETEYINLLMSEDSMTPEDLSDKFIETVRSKTDYIIESHLIKIVDYATLEEAISIMEFFYNLQDLHDYSQLSVTLHSSTDIHECLALAIHDHSSMPPHRAMEIISFIDPIMYQNLVNYVEKKVSNIPSSLMRYSDIGKEIVENMRKYISFTKKTNLIGASLMDASVILNQSIKNYSVFIGTAFNSMSIDDTAYNYLSVLYLTKDGIDKPLETYRDTIGIFIEDIDLIASVETKLNTIVGEYTTYLEIENARAQTN